MVWFWAIMGYLSGAIPFGVLLGKTAGVDLLKSGSGNPGATNALRTAGPTVGAAVFLLDILKGFLPALLALRYGGQTAGLATGLAAIIGHNWSLFLGLRGGKGMSTSLGVVLAWHWPSALLAFAVWLAILLLTRYVSVASMVAGASLPFFFVLGRVGGSLIGAGVVMALLIFYRHLPNLQRLREGREYKFGERVKSADRGER